MEGKLFVVLKLESNTNVAPGMYIPQSVVSIVVAAEFLRYNFKLAFPVPIITLEFPFSQRNSLIPEPATRPAAESSEAV